MTPLRGSRRLGWAVTAIALAAWVTALSLPDWAAGDDLLVALVVFLGGLALGLAAGTWRILWGLSLLPVLAVIFPDPDSGGSGTLVLVMAITVPLVGAAVATGVWLRKALAARHNGPEG